MIGKWEAEFGVWENPTPPLGRLLAQTGRVAEHVIVTLGDAHNRPPHANFSFVVDGLSVRFTSLRTDPE